MRVLIFLLSFSLWSAPYFADAKTLSRTEWDVTSNSWVVTYATDPDSEAPSCDSCSKDVPPLPKVELNSKLNLDRSMQWLEGILPCEGLSLLKRHKQTLLKAQSAFGVPAPVMACLIAAESKWDPSIDQLDRNASTEKYNGSFVGLAQSYKPTFEALGNDIKSQPRLGEMWRQYASDISPDVFNCDPVRKNSRGEKIIWPVCKNMFIKREVIRDCPLRRCMSQPHGQAEIDLVARRAIGFAGAYLRQTNDTFIALASQNHTAQEIGFLKNTKRTQWLATAVGYNAGPGVAYSYLPQFVLGGNYDNGSWIPYLRTPPAKFEQSVAKVGEVVQYIDWINSCLDGNKAVGPPDRRVSLANAACFGNTSRDSITKLLRIRRSHSACTPLTGNPNQLCSQAASPGKTCDQLPPKPRPGRSDGKCEYRF